MAKELAYQRKKQFLLKQRSLYDMIKNNSYIKIIDGVLHEY